MSETPARRRERLATPGEGERLLAALREEKQNQRERNQTWDDAAEERREDTPLELIDRSDWERLSNLSRRHFPRELAESLHFFRKRWRKALWMQQQHGYVEKVALALSSRCRFDGQRFANCQPRQLCQMPHLCPRCSSKQAERAHEEYGQVFEKAAYWFAAVPSLSYRPETAGLHLVTRKKSDGRAKEYRHWRPFTNRRAKRGLTLDVADWHTLCLLLCVPFEFARRLQKRELSDGAFVTREIALDFIPRSEPVPACELRVAEVVLPHGNCLLNARRKPCWRLALECFEVLVQIWADWNLFDYGYPDLMIGKAMDGQEEIDRWLSYELKPMAFEKFYHSGIQNGCDLKHLNLHFDQTVFCGIKTAFNTVKSPRKLGNLNSDPRSRARQIEDHRRYLGRKPANRMISRIKAKIRRCNESVPPRDILEALSRTELQFLVDHGLNNQELTVTQLDALEGEMRA